MAREYGQFDPFRGIDQAKVESIRTVAGLLEKRSRSAEEVAVRTAYLDLLDIQPGEHVLDVGCGSGIPCETWHGGSGRLAGQWGWGTARHSW